MMARLGHIAYRLTVTLVMLAAVLGIAFYARSPGAASAADGVVVPPSSFAPYEEPLTDLPRYPGVRAVPVGISMGTLGMRTQVEFFQTRDSAFRVEEFFQAYWRTQGYKVFRHAAGDGTVHVSVVDAFEKLVKVATVMPRSDVRDVFVAAIDVSGSAIEDFENRMYNELGAAAGGDAIARMMQPEGETLYREQQGMAFRPGLPLQVAAQTEAELTRAGWQVIQKNSSGLEPADGVVRHVVRGSSRVRLVFGDVRGARATVIMVEGEGQE